MKFGFRIVFETTDSMTKYLECFKGAIDFRGSNRAKAILEGVITDDTMDLKEALQDPEYQESWGIASYQIWEIREPKKED